MGKRFLWILVFSILFISGCHSEVQIEPKQSPKEVLQLYLEAVKKQDGLTMADYTLDHSGVDFTISEEEAKTWGLRSESMQKLYVQLLNFTYKSDEAVINEPKAEIKLYVQAYDVSKVLEDIVKKQEENFQEINGDDLSDADKNQKIADIIVEEFQNAERTKSFDLIVHLQLAENEWLIDPKDEAKLLEMLFAIDS